MGRFQTVLSFLALPAERQILLIPETPYDRGVADYYLALNHNPLQLLVRGIFEDYSQAESESDNDYLARTGIGLGHPCAVLNELCCFIYLLRHHYAADDFWNQRALAERDEWRLLRRLANLSLAEIGSEISCTRQDIQDAITSFKREFAHT
jgi:hypothetical protein